MTPRWSVERKARTYDGDLLQIVEIYAEGENEEQVKQENKLWTHRRRLVLVDKKEVS